MLLDKMGDRLAYVDVVEEFQRKQTSRDRDRERSNSRDRDHSRNNYKNRDKDRRDSRDYNRNKNRDRHRGRSNSINESDRRKNQQRSGTSQRDFDKNELCNYCDRTGYTTHRCHKLENYLKRKGKKIILHEEEDVQESEGRSREFITKFS